MPTGTFTADAIIAAADLLRHYRERDHEGTEDDTTVVTTEVLLGYPIGTTLDQVLAAMWAHAT